ncbi:MAG: rhomboid family intramembrane serine protease [Candidatus Acidiferrales bacterium]
MVSPRLRWKLTRARERLRETFAGLFQQPPRPRVCFSCGRLVGAAEKVCSHCGASQAALSLSAFKRVALAIVPAEHAVTYILLLANLLFFAVSVIISQRAGAQGLFDTSSEVLYLLGAKQGWAIFVQGEYWRLVMPIFLHAGVFHFAMNSFVLWQVGPQVEDLFGSARYLFLYLAPGVIGFAASAWWYHPAAISVGASGSIFGLIGILISYISQQRGFSSEYRASLIRWAVFIIIIGIFFPFDNAAHIGGLVSGMALGRMVSARRPVTPAARFRVNLMGWGSAAIIFWSLAMVLLNLPAASGR